MTRLEFRVIGFNLLWITTVVFLIFSLIITKTGDQVDSIILVFEVFLPMYIMIAISEAVKIRTDRAVEILLVSAKSYFKIILMRYTVAFITLSVMSIVYMVIIHLSFKELNIIKMIFTFLSPSIFLSSFSLLFSFYVRNGISGSVVGGLLWIFNMLAREVMQKVPLVYVFLFISLFSKDNYVWVLNKLALILASFILWIIIHFICKKRTFLYD